MSFSVIHNHTFVHLCTCVSLITASFPTTGHVLSMPHDDSKTCERLFGDLGGHYLMAPLFVSLNKTAPWSPCSALYITEFFDNGHGRKYFRLPPQRVKNYTLSKSETERPCRDRLPTWTSATTLWLCY